MSNFLVSSLSLTSAPRASIARIQQELVTAQKEVATGRLADVGLGLGVSVGRTISMRAEMTNIEKLTGTNNAIAQRFETMQTVLGSVAATGENLLSSLISSGEAKPSAGVQKMSALADIGQLVGALNTSSGSRHLFAGAKTDTAPMMDDLVKGYETSEAAESVKDAWGALLEGLDKKPSEITADELRGFLGSDGAFDELFNDEAWETNWSKASDNQTVNRIGEDDMLTSSASANEAPFREVMKSYVMLASLDIDQLNDEARQVLTSRSIETLSKGLSGITDLQSRIGFGEERIEKANERLKSQSLVLKIAIGKEEDVDQYEASTRVTNLMNTLETSYALTARISRLSLLNYL